jgi:hypothetical protein
LGFNSISLERNKPICPYTALVPSIKSGEIVFVKQLQIRESGDWAME